MKPRASAAVAALLTGAVGLSACGATKPAQSAVQAKLKTISQFSQVDDATTACIAGVLEKYGTAGSLRTFVRTGNPSDIKGRTSDESTVQAQTQACLSKDGK